MRIQSIGIFANPNNEGALAAVSSVYGVARSRGIKCFIDRSFANMEEFSGYETIQEQVPGLMIAIGGDGTILHAAGYAAEHDIPILGINFGRIGFLSEIDVEGISEALDAIESEQYRTDKCMMLSCSVNGCAAKDCLNEAVLYRKKFSGVVSITVNVNGIDAGTVSCDGLIVATPTGSTGYSISAGGPVIELSIKQEGFLGMDGVSTERIVPGDMVRICRSRRSVRFIRLGDRNLYSLIRNKLS